MQTAIQMSWRNNIDEVISRFQQWRSTHVRGSRIPEPLWQLALELAKRHGMTRTAKTLGLNIDVLHRRLNPDAAGRTGQARSSKGRAHFVELPIASSAGSRSCTIEFREGAGDALLRVELGGFAPEELGALIRVIRSGQQA